MSAMASSNRWRVFWSGIGYVAREDAHEVIRLVEKQESDIRHSCYIEGFQEGYRLPDIPCTRGVNRYPDLW